MPLYYGERSWNSLKLRSFLQAVNATGFTPTTYATSGSDLSNGVTTEREENPPLTSVISLQRNIREHLTFLYIGGCFATAPVSASDLFPLTPALSFREVCVCGERSRPGCRSARPRAEHCRTGCERRACPPR